LVLYTYKITVLSNCHNLAIVRVYFIVTLSFLQQQAVFDEYFPKVYGYLYRRLDSRQDVEEVTSVVLTKLFAALERQHIEYLNAYLWSIARSSLIDYIRAKKNHRVSALPAKETAAQSYELD
jgi:RNA polymerase sigma factor (sigma-70 family)